MNDDLKPEAETTVPRDAVPSPVCPQCGAEVAVGRDRCWLCGANFGTPFKATSAPPANQPPPSPVLQPQFERTFSLSSLMLVVTWVAVCLGVASAVPGLGILLGIASAPALLRVTFMSAHRTVRGDILTTGEKVGFFIGSLALMFVIGLAAAATFWATCTAIILPTQRLEWLGPAFLIGGVAGLLVAGWLLIKTWPKRDRP